MPQEQLAKSRSLSRLTEESLPATYLYKILCNHPLFKTLMSLSENEIELINIGIPIHGVDIHSHKFQHIRENMTQSVSYSNDGNSNYFCGPSTSSSGPLVVSNVFGAHVFGK